LVIGGDNLFNGDLKEFLSFVKGNPNPVIGAYNIKDMRQAKKYGVIKLDRKNKLIDFKEKPKNPESALIAMCLYYFPKEKLKLIKEYLNRKAGKHDATGFYIDWLRKMVSVYGFVFEGYWYDIGDHKFYREARLKLMRSQN
ncbi:MAG: sugar phosphate nucleotidyltransferase, partial [Candidatus Omnitrophota bacterium]|nr:sugar phosphate nucleotidyltransferase [Candidatus Omnitrophota bacterium]